MKDQTPRAKNKVVTTRLPARLQAYLKSLASLQFGKLSHMHTAMLDEFLLRQPWKNGLAWRETRGLSTRDQADRMGTAGTGWMQVNFTVTDMMAEELEALAKNQNITLSALLYTACYWWSWYKFPPEHEALRRKNSGLPVDIDHISP